ncbi:MAG: DUF4337 domain-containing protein [Pseudomonadota bacterium]
MEIEEIREEVTEEMLDSKAKESWINYLALTTVILAVCATLSSFKEGNYSVDSVLNQTQASDQWAYYQSKSIKGYLYEMQREELEIGLKSDGKDLSPLKREQYEKKVDEYGKRIERYDKEKKEIMKEARKYEGSRDDAQQRAGAYGFAVIFLQMGILMCSLSALMKKKALWLLGGVVGGVGLVYFANGYLLLF